MRPDISVRIDPFNWLLEGRLGVELEASRKFISVEIVPIFLVNSQPPYLNLSGGFPDVLEQESNGLGPLAAASLGVGFWISGEPFDGTVLKAIYEHSGYTYRTEDEFGDIDEVTHTGRRLFGFLGGQRRFPRDGVFTIAGGIGLGWEFNQQSRCFVGGQPSSDCRNDDLLIALDTSKNEVVDLNGSLHPAYLMGRISLGVVF